MAATYTTYDLGDTIAATSGGNAAGFPAQTVLVGEFDASRRNLIAADTVEVVNIPAGTHVTAVYAEVLTADATMTYDVGDGVDPNGYVATGDAATTGAVLGAGTLAGTTKFYAAADTIDVTVPATKALDTFKVRVFVECTILGTS